MPTKEEIFDNISLYTAEQIVGFIRQGIVTEIELEDSDNTGGEYSSDMRKKVNELLNDQEPADWNKALEINTVAGYQYYLDTYPDGAHREEARNRKRELQNVGAAPEPKQPEHPSDRWELVDKESLVGLQAFIEAHPDSPHVPEAKRLVNKIINKQSQEELTGIDMEAMIKRIKNIQADKKVLDPVETVFSLIVTNLNKGRITLKELVDAIAEDKNLLAAKVIHKLYDEGYLTMADFGAMNVDMAFVQHMLEDVPPQKFNSPRPMAQISKPSTEIYFWGIPSSGKSCALGGILSVAGGGKVASHMDKDPHCQGYEYMSRLMLLVNDDGSVGTLPEGTSTTSTYEMGFNLTDNAGMVHPITCIDLAGEMIRCMFKFDSGIDLEEKELITLDTLTRILVDNRTQNRKMHFFVIEYGADDRYYEGLPQRVYLEAAVQYIRSYEIFNRNTDAIFILVSKVDKVPKGVSRNAALAEYLDKNYRGFVNGLKSICKENEINGGDVEVVPFSLGNVCFQNYCQFDDAAARLVVEKIIERTPGFKADKINKLLGKLKG